ncbi:single-stranded DNA-binding protein [Candidatus Poribacteria bacterium]|nr:single-stranded DNA-binding protein [Candidatus Poribacteria bacterium]MYF54941.1 single-stranded DNA-binding protein [Candidatus Poribacteria bacterium]MYI93208.1 single-stranded DNA-binding protein [Candidatus Poribacteria bacterium]
MASYNRVILMGNLTRDPEMKYLPSGTAVTNFGLAMSEKYTDRESGDLKETVCFVDVEAWGRQGEIVNEYLSKGSPVFIEGSLKFDSWETPEGEKRNKLKVRVFRLQLIGGRRDGDEMGGGYTDAIPAEQSQAQPEQTQDQSAGGGSPSTTDDDIPF